MAGKAKPMPKGTMKLPKPTDADPKTKVAKSPLAAIQNPVKVVGDLTHNYKFHQKGGVKKVKK